jgi:hypothetical protein
MFPAVRPGDVLVLKRTGSSEVCSGDIVLFARDHRLFAHRVVASNGLTLLTRGDAMSAPDARVEENELLGRVSFIIRKGKCVVPRKTLRTVERAVSKLVNHSDFTLRIISGIHGRLQSQVQTT